MIKLIAFLIFTSAALACDDLPYGRDPLFLGEKYRTGYVPLNDKRDSLFYWMFESRRSPSKDPLILYLQSNIGMTSQTSVFFEGGPFRLNKDNTTVRSNPYAWNNIANVISVDSPIGTGFSIANSFEAFSTSSDETAQDLYTFMQGFLKQNPSFAGRDFYVASLSFNGKVLIKFCNLMAKNPKGLNLKLKGYSLQAPVIYIKPQFSTWFEFAYENDLISHDLARELEKAFALYGGKVSSTENETTISDALDQVGALMDNITGVPPRFNPLAYNHGCTPDAPDFYCLDYSDLITFMTQPKVLKALNVANPSVWAISNYTADEISYGDFVSNSLDVLTQLVQQDVPGIITCGSTDLYWNCLGVEQLVNSINWSGQKKFKDLKHTVWGKYGEYKHLNTLTYMEIYGAGHQIPMYQPESSYAVLRRMLGEGGAW